MRNKRNLAGFITFLLLFALPAHPVNGEIPLKVTVVSEIMFGSQSDYSPAKWYEEDGCRYGLESWELEPVTLEPRPERVEQEVLFEEVENEDMLPSTKSISLEEEFSGLSVASDYPVTGVKKVKERWQDGFSFPVVFHSYGAQAYQLGEREVTQGDEKPLSEEWGLALLKEIGVDASRYKVTDTRWDGAPYFDEDHVFCRNAMALGEKLVADYLVTYSGTAVFPEVEGFRCLAVYGLNEPVMEKASDQEIISQGDPEKSADSHWIINNRLVVFTVSAMVLLALLLILAWIARKLKKGGKKKERKRKWEIKRGRK